MRLAFAFNVKHNKPSLHVGDEVDQDFDEPKTIDGIEKTLQDLGHSVLRIEADDSAFEKLKAYKEKIDLVFNIAEGLSGDARESQIPLYCEVLKIPYTHSSPTTHAISLDKTYSKYLVKGAGVLVPFSVLVSEKSPDLPDKLPFPLIVKPNSEGSSIGVFDKNVVDDREALINRINAMYDEGFIGSLLVEQFIDGREFTVSIIGNNPPRILPVIEQKFNFLPAGYRKIAGYELKWLYEDNLKDFSEAYDCPANISSSVQHMIEDTSLLVYNTLKVKDCARLDYRLSSDSKLFFIEINTLPGINPDNTVISYLPVSARIVGLSFKDLVDSIIKSAAERYGL